MRHAIVDNATLTAVQRVLGDIEIFNALSLDGDLAALENLVVGILFYDKLFVINDYKEEFRAARLSRFDFCLPIEKSEFPYEALNTQANEAVKDIILRVAGGKIDNNAFGTFLNTLKLHTTYTWDMASSNFFLTMKMLQGKNSIDIEKYSKLNQTIFAELNASQEENFGQNNDRRPLLLSSDGTPIPRLSHKDERRFEVSKQVYAFASSLNWLSLRTAFYTLLAAQFSADCISHPMRSAFQVSFSGPSGFADHKFREFLLKIHNEAKDTIIDIKSNTDNIFAKLNFPIFSAWIANQTKDPNEIIDFALNLRTKEPFVEARRQLIALEELQDLKNSTKYVTKVNRILRELGKTSELLRSQFGVTEANGVSLSPVIFLINIGLSLAGLPNLPDVPFKIKRPDFMHVFEKRSGFHGVIRSVVQDLTAIERLGSTHAILTSKARIKIDEYSKKPLEILFKKEEEKYFGKESGWKIPM